MRPLWLVSWACYLVGVALVLGQWIGLVSSGVAWAGFAIGMAGWAMQWLPGYKRISPEDEVSKLEDLRDRGLISEEECERRSRMALGRK